MNLKSIGQKLLNSQRNDERFIYYVFLLLSITKLKFDRYANITISNLPMYSKILYKRYKTHIM